MVSIISDILSLFRERDEFPDARYLKWELGQGCRGCKVCEPLAARDGYGLGPGVYPKDKLPRRHFGCRCKKRPVEP